MTFILNRQIFFEKFISITYYTLLQRFYFL